MLRESTGTGPWLNRALWPFKPRRSRNGERGDWRGRLYTGSARPAIAWARPPAQAVARAREAAG